MFTIRQIFQDLFHPTQSGALSEWIGRRLFRLLRRRKRLLASAGPLSVVTVILVWATLLVVGFALIYWSVFPNDFQIRSTNQPTNSDGFWWVLYYSLEMLTTLGLGDIQPTPNWLRILSGCHTLIGFTLVTASITWIVLLFPALRRTRTLARKATTLVESETKTGVPVASARMHLVLFGLAEEVIRARVDLVHFPILFYFYAEDQRASLPHALLKLTGVASQAVERERDNLVRLGGTALMTALQDFSDNLAERLGVEVRSPESVLQAYAKLHSAP